MSKQSTVYWKDILCFIFKAMKYGDLKKNYPSKDYFFHFHFIMFLDLAIGRGLIRSPLYKLFLLNHVLASGIQKLHVYMWHNFCFTKLA